MRQLLLQFFLVLGVVGLFQGCTNETVIVVDNSPPAASVTYDYRAGFRNVDVTGEIYNDGRSLVSNVELETVTLDEYGNVLSIYYDLFNVNLLPNEFTTFEITIRERRVEYVEVNITYVD